MITKYFQASPDILVLASEYSHTNPRIFSPLSILDISTLSGKFICGGTGGPWLLTFYNYLLPCNNENFASCVANVIQSAYLQPPTPNP